MSERADLNDITQRETLQTPQDKLDAKNNAGLKILQDQVDKLVKKDKITFTLSGLSIVAAATSAFFAMQTNYRDAAYREYAIQPRLEFVIDADGLSMSIRNVGLGPALVKRVILTDGNNCYDTNHLQDYVAWGVAQADFFVRIENEIKETLDNKRSSQKGQMPSSRISSIINFLSEDRYMQPNSSNTVISFKIDGRTAPFDATPENTKSLSSAALGPFVRSVSKRRIYVEYCSVSNGYCSNVGAEALAICNSNSNSNSNR